MRSSSIRVRFGFLGLLLVLVVVCTAAAYGIGHFRSSADQARRTELALRDAHTALFAADAAEWRAIARRQLDPAGAAAFRREVGDARAALVASRAHDAWAVPIAAAALTDVSRYRAAAGAEFALIDRRAFETATQVDRRRVDPIFDTLDASLTAAIGRSEDRRATSEARAVLAARVIVISAAAIMFLALGLFGRARRRALVSLLERRALESQVAERGFEADHDVLTGLLNRRGFFTRLRDVVGLDDGTPFAVLLLDLDGFKEINDTLGHGAGDTLLGQIGPRLRQAVRETDTFARLGGDEFAIVVRGPGAPDSAVDVGRRVRTALIAPFHVAGLSLQIRASVGIALFPEHGPTAEELVRRADIAMYQAKQSRTGVAVYASADDPRSRHMLQLASDLEQAIEAGQLVVHYQPKADLQTGAITGVEALVRWQHPERGLLLPDTFVPIAERNGLIRRLTLDVMRRALAQQAQWRAEGIDLALAVNLSIANLLDAELPREIAGLLAMHPGRSGRVQVEITESYLVTDPTLIHSNIQQLCAHGLRLALDDFGTGYSSFTHLRRLPIDEIKIDRSFIAGLESDGDDAVIVRSTIDLAHSLNLAVVAEGVESAVVWERLREFGCDEAQGFHLARPMPAHALTGWLARRAAEADSAVATRPPAGRR